MLNGCRLTRRSVLTGLATASVVGAIERSAAQDWPARPMTMGAKPHARN